MSSKRIVLSFTGLKALIDATARTDRIPTLLKALTAARKNGACRAFGAPTFALDRPPSRGDATSLAELPSDERVREVALATTFSGVVGVLLLVEVRAPIQLPLWRCALGIRSARPSHPARDAAPPVRSLRTPSTSSCPARSTRRRCRSC